MDEKEFIDKEVIPSYAKVLKSLFEKYPNIRKMYEDELKQQHKDHDNDPDDPIFKFLMK